MERASYYVSISLVSKSYRMGIDDYCGGHNITSLSASQDSSLIDRCLQGGNGIHYYAKDVCLCFSSTCRRWHQRMVQSGACGETTVVVPSIVSDICCTLLTLLLSHSK